jgi:hypothetical protein
LVHRWSECSPNGLHCQLRWPALRFWSAGFAYLVRGGEE